LYVVGDFTLGGEDVARHYREQIACRRVHLIKGNHDRPSVSKVFGPMPHIKKIRVEGQKVILCHYPMMTWEGRGRGYAHLYGHVHNAIEFGSRGSMNVGWDIYMKPLEAQEVFDLLGKYVWPERWWEGQDYHVER
jgi:calcineurin-like phosphoesterase family protein